jgi:hypothetical protein
VAVRLEIMLRAAGGLAAAPLLASEARLGGVPPREFSMSKAHERVPLA